MSNRTNYQKKYERDYEDLNKKYFDISNKFNKVNEELKISKYEYNLLNIKYENKCKQVQKADEKAAKKYEPIIEEKDKIIEEKDKEIERLKALLNIDSTNSGLPTSKTPLNKNTLISNANSREKSWKSIGGQKGHPKHKLEKFKDEEINEKIVHELTKCPECGGEIKKVKEVYKDELTYKVVPIKRRHVFETYECTCCHKEVHENIPVRL